jgi:hypothetical protein
MLSSAMVMLLTGSFPGKLLVWPTGVNGVRISEAHLLDCVKLELPSLHLGSCGDKGPVYV